MAWTTTAPTLPNGSSWVQEQTTNFVQNHWTLNTTRSIARLDGNNIAVKVVAVMSNGSYGTFYAPGKYHLSMTAGGQTVTDTTTYSMSKGTQTFYCTSVAEPSSAVSTTVGYIDSSSSRKVVNFTAPALLVVTLNISFDAQNGTACTAITRDQNNTYGELPVSYRRGNKFLGWSTDTTSANIVSSSTVITQSADFTLYAIWKFIGALYVKINGSWQTIY